MSFENFSAFPPASGDKISYAASLQTLNFAITKGHLIVIVGPPGSGKVRVFEVYGRQANDVLTVEYTVELWLFK